MPLSSFRKWLSRASARQGAAARRARFPRFFLEVLEDRTLLATTFTVNLPGDVGTGAGTTGDIRFAINQANQPINVGSTIIFDTSRTKSPITLTHGELQIAQNMTITGPGLSILTIMPMQTADPVAPGGTRGIS